MKGQKIQNVLISNDPIKIHTNCSNFFSSPENKLQLIRLLCTAPPRYAQVKEDCQFYIYRGFDDPTKCFKLISIF